MLLWAARLASAAPQPDTTTNPYAQFDPDGVPLAVTQTPGHPLTTAQINVLRQAAQDEVRNRNWLLIGFEEQQARATSTSGEEHRPNLYLQLSMDRSLAEFGGLDRPSNPSSTPPPALHVTPTLAAGTLGLRPEAPNASVTLATLSPLSSAGSDIVQGLRAPPFAAFGSGLGISGSGPFTPSPTETAATAPSPVHSAAYLEATDMQTPGMVAAKTDPLTDQTTPDLSLDSLPNQADEAAREAAASTPPTLSQAMSADTLHEIQEAKLATPTLAAQTKVPPSELLARKADAEKPAMIPVNPADAPMQVTKQPLLNPVHPAMGSPLDMLNR